MKKVLVTMLVTALTAGCSVGTEDPTALKEAIVDYGLLQTLPTDPISFTDQVQPILENRCVVCHGCYDAPCQLKLSSIEGIRRGANEKKVYNAARITAAEPTRLGIDARGVGEWRERGFYPVLNERVAANPEQNLRNSAMYQMLRLKQLHPQPRIGLLPKSVDVSLKRKQVCPKIGAFDAFAERNPLWGMPYGMPNLGDAEYRTLVQWIAQGSPESLAARPTPESARQVGAWEDFLNGSGNKQRLMSRYVFEHLFQGHLHFAGAPDREFFRLVRSRTPPGEPVDEIATSRPFDDPGTEDFYYRLKFHRPTIVAKSHVIYELSEARLDRYRELFLAPAYDVAALPSYDPELASNPFLTFDPIPPNSRYRFLLDDARFFIDGFIKGPVCRGQVALNVIEDHFWVVFFNPDRNLFTERPEFLRAAAEHLKTPSESVSTLNLLATWTKYWEGQETYLAEKEKYIRRIHAFDVDDALEYIWDGDGSNRNAALTVFRHFDSASVVNGLVGDYPETAWIIDFPLFERIHYLLVAGFDVYGNIGHQLNTRLYMDFLRMEGEDHFLAFLPAADRKAIRNSWYLGLRSRRAKLMNEPMNWTNVETVIGYETDDPQLELYRYIESRLGPIARIRTPLHRCADDPCASAGDADPVDAAMARLGTLRGPILEIFPDLALLRVRDDGTGQDRSYTLIQNKGYQNVTSIFSNEDNRDRNNDTLTVIRGIVGAYPNFFLMVDAGDIETFVHDLSAIRNREDYEQVMAVYGIRRTNPEFWSVADWFQATFANQSPREAGILDLNRYRNR